MSAPQGNPGDDKKPFSKFIRRASKALKPSSPRTSSASEPSARVSSQGPKSATTTAASPPPPSSQDRPSVRPTQPAQPVQQTTPKDTVTRIAAPKVLVDTNPPLSPPSSLPVLPNAPIPRSAKAHGQLQGQKYTTLFAKYGLSLDDWTPPDVGHNPYVEKKIIMRVHRQCHRCMTAFTTEKTCTNCQHVRCTKCPRFPGKRPKESRDQMSAVRQVDPNHDLRQAKQHMAALRVSTKGDGNDLVRKVPVHRVRRFCHKCETTFKGKATVCEKCQHPRCPQCPRDPPKTHKYPNGYPGDEEEKFAPAERILKQTRHRYRYHCHECSAAFQEHTKVCSKCSHQRCDQCPRIPPKKVRPKPSVDILKSLEERLASVALSPAA